VTVLEAAKLAKVLMTQHRLIGWKFQYTQERTTFGSCNHGLKIIRLSAPLVELNSDYEVKDTILHEIAHALVGPGHDHDRVWMRKASEIGARPEATYDSKQVEAVPLKYVTQLTYSSWKEAWKEQGGDK
jgi:predicted SprT family Zn-dependent metalloprotease